MSAVSLPLLIWKNFEVVSSQFLKGISLSSLARDVRSLDAFRNCSCCTMIRSLDKLTYLLSLWALNELDGSAKVFLITDSYENTVRKTHYLRLSILMGFNQETHPGPFVVY